MTPRSWWASFFARPVVVPRRTRLSAVIALETLPDRDSPSSIDSGGFESPAGPPPDAVRPTSVPSDPAPPAGQVALPPPVPLAAEPTPIAPPRVDLLAGTTWVVELDGSLDALFPSESLASAPPIPPASGSVAPAEFAAAPPPRGTPVDANTTSPPANADTPAPVSSGASVAVWPPVTVIVRAITVTPPRPAPPPPPPVAPPTPQVSSAPPGSIPPAAFDVSVPTIPVIPAVPPATNDRSPTPTANTTELPAPSAPANPANVAVVPVPPAPGQLITPDTPVFRISRPPASGEPLTVSFTLAAHAAGGTTAFGGTVVLRRDTPHAAVTPRPVLAGGNPDILTVVLNEAPGGQPTGRSATLFVAPAQLVADPVLVEAHREGRSAEAFGVLTRRYGPAVNRTVLRIVGNRADAEDVSQFVFMELAKTRVKFPGALSGWLRAVSRNAALAFLRAKRRRLRHEQNGAKAEAVEPSPPAAIDESLVVALRQLPPDLGQAVRLRYVDGFSQQEAAAIAGVPRGTLSRRAAAGVSLLRDLLEWEPDGEQPDCERHSG